MNEEDLQPWQKDVVAKLRDSYSAQPPQIITTEHHSIITDQQRRNAFAALDKVKNSLRPNATEVGVGLCNFSKHPVSGDWLLKTSGDTLGSIIIYTRYRQLYSIEHYHAALQTAIIELTRLPKALSYSIGGIAMQFIKLDNGDRVLINSVQEPLVPLKLTQSEFQSIIDDADNFFSAFPKQRGGFYKNYYVVEQTETLKHTVDVWCWDDNGSISILNPLTIVDDNVDYNMAKYKLRKSDELLIRVLDSGNSNVALLLGKPGTGKTFFTDCYAKRIGAEYIYALCHDGTNSEDLFYSINVGKAVLREAETSNEIYQEGILLRAVRASHHHKVVVCIDEIDKASKRTENLFLDFAETYRVPFLETQEQGVKENIVLFFTSNGYRPHSEAFLRRCYRHHFDFLPRSVEISLIGGTFAPTIVDALTAIREGGASSPSIKEGMLFAQNLQFATNVKDVECLMYAHLCKEPEDMEILQKGNFANKFITKVF